MRITLVTIDGDYGNWGEIFSSGIRIWYEDDNLRTGDISITTNDESKVRIDMGDRKISEAQFLDLMSKLYDMAEVK